MEMEELIKRMRKIYNEWDLKVMVVVSLGFQILLMFLGGRRKFTSKLWVRGIVWFAYISADSIAALALGVLSSKLVEISDESAGTTSTLDDNTRLLALWSPCLVLLLGGPDSITAYALEDNELWLRHLIGLAVQSIVAAYIYFLAWSVSYLSLVSILMLVAALIKYGERVWVLWQASRDKLEDSMYVAKSSSSNHEEVRLQVQPKLCDHSQEELLVMAYNLFRIFKRLFVNLNLTRIDIDASVTEFERLDWRRSFNIVEMELGFMYDVLHTKAVVLFTPWGVCRRIITCTLSSTVFALFAFTHDQHYPTPDLTLTFLLLASIIFIELYSVVMLLASDWASVSSIITNNFNLQLVSFFRKLLTQPRWSNCVGQLSFFSFTNPLPCDRTLKLLCLHNLYYSTQKTIPDYIKEQILSHTGIKYQPYKDNFAEHIPLLNQVLKDQAHVDLDDKGNPVTLNWAKDTQFDQAVLILHITTELCYYYSYPVNNHNNPPPPQDIYETRKSAKLLSRYMYYLMVRYPFMLPIGFGPIRLRDTLSEALQFFQERGLFSQDGKMTKKQLRQLSHNMLLKVNTQVPPHKVKGGQSKSVLFDACILANQLINNVDYSDMWQTIFKSWLVLLYSAAYKCTGDIHAGQLRRGGELLTHVWMMMAHFGFTNRLSKAQGHPG